MVKIRFSHFISITSVQFKCRQIIPHTPATHAFYGQAPICCTAACPLRTTNELKINIYVVNGFYYAVIKSNT